MDILKELENKKSEIMLYLKNQLAGIRGGRPTTKLVENIQVDYSGQKLKVMQLGSLSINPPREIVISVWDTGVLPTISAGIEKSLSLQPRIEGNLIRLNLPPLSSERRLELTKTVKQEVEETRIKIRSLRDELMKKIKKQEEEKKLSENEMFQLKGKVEQGIKKTNEEIDKLLGDKIKEINE